MRNAPTPVKSVPRPPTCGAKKRAATLLAVKNAVTHENSAGLLGPKAHESWNGPKQLGRKWACSGNHEIVSVVRIFPKIIGIDDQVFSEGLLETSMEFIALSGQDRRRGPKQSFGDRISHGTGEDQVFIKRDSITRAYEILRTVLVRLML